ncbi:MAG TPA: ketopantoate reductase C-terminal domain-containing protein [Solimonas sp.]|nr:ketopantoate reductase C-terminal domain-containing protein [Solimonas sp.]
MILLVGAGAVGTILSAYLQAAGREPLKLYARPKDRAPMQQAQALQVDYVKPGQPPLQVAKPALTSSLDLAGVDYLVICVKYPALDRLLDELGPIPPGCTIVSTLNGMAGLRLLRQRLPQARIVPMTIMYNGQLLGPLHAQITTRAQVFVGSDDAHLLGAFRGSGMAVARAEGDASAWGKILINLANAVCAVTHTTFKDLLTQTDLRESYAAVLDEAIATLTRAGVPYKLPMPLPYPLYRRMLTRGGPLPWWFAKLKNGLQEGAYPSMVADVEAGRETEVAQLNGEIAALGRERGLATPVNDSIVSLVQAMAGQLPPPYLSPAALRSRLGI